VRKEIVVGLSDMSDICSVDPRVLERRVSTDLSYMSDNISVGLRGAQRRAKGNCRGSERHE
jgi:hypothetical protein